MADLVTVTQYFPCAKAPFDDGAHRLWTEANITDIFSFIFDVDTKETPLVNYNGTKLLVGGYMFTGEFTVGDNYWIILDNGELDCDTSTETTSVQLYTGSAPTPGTGKTVIGGPSQRLKFTQPSIGNIDLQPSQE